jgi:Zn-finger protein
MCHKGIKEKDFNCLWCYCVLYDKITNIQVVGEEILVKRGCGKNYCEKCIFPHKRENYDKIIKLLKKSTL